MKPLIHSSRRLAGALAAMLVAAAPAQSQVDWTDWTAATTNAVTGTLLFNSTAVGVTYSGPYSFTQLGAPCSPNYWAANSAVYTGGPITAPPDACEMIALGTGGLKTITFSQPVVNPILALVSWNGQPNVPFNGPVQVINSGCGHWGCGTFSATGNVLHGSAGEPHGVIRLIGTYSQLSFTDASEGWHGITVGAESLAISGVPEPSTYVLMATGLVGVFAAARRRRSA